MSDFTDFTQASDIADTDKLVGHSGTASGAERGILWSLIKSKLKTYFDTLYAAITHTHAQSDITDLTTDLAGKAASSHTHAQSDITNLTSDLAGKAASSHTHAQSDVTNLVTDLAGKQPLASVLTNTTASFTTAQESKLAGIEASADVTDAGNVGSAIHGATGKTTPVDADTIPLIDSEASNVLKKLTWANLKATLKTYFDTVYTTAAAALSAAQAIKLDDFATPDDNTDLDATTGRHGLLPKLGGGTTNFLRADGTWAAPSGSGGGTKTYAVLQPWDGIPPASNGATRDTRNGIRVLDFDDTTDESVTFDNLIMPEAASLGSGLKVRLWLMATSATSGDFRYTAEFERCNTDQDADSFDTATAGTVTVHATSGTPFELEITATAIDSIAAGELYRLRITRTPSNGADTAAGDAELRGVEIRSAA